MKITKNFSLNEFTRSATADKLGIDNSLPLDGISDLYIKNLVVHLLQPIRNTFGRMTINSGYRSEALNKAVGGVPTSQHRKAQAADIAFCEAKIKDVWQYLNDNPDNLKWDQVILYRKQNFIHFSYNEGQNRM